MKKRILSLILAVCMVAVAVPALLLPTFAAETVGFTTRFSTTENFPSFTPGVGLDQYNGNWEIGNFRAGAYSVATGFDKTHNIVSETGAQWADTGMYLQASAGRIILTGTGNTSYMAAGGPQVAFALTYTAGYEGTIDISIDSLAPFKGSDAYTIPAGTPEAFYLGVFVNDTMIFPTEGGSIINPDDFALISAQADLLNNPNLGKLQNVEVNIGDKVHFVCARYSTHYCTLTPAITYHDGYELVPTRMNQTYGPSSATWPEHRSLSGMGALTQTDAVWSLGNYTVADGSFTKYVKNFKTSVAAWAAEGELATDFNFFNKPGVILYAPSAGNAQGSFIMGGLDAGVLPAYKGAAAACGKAEFSVGSLYAFNNNLGVVKNASAAVDVFVNGEKVGTLNVTTDGKGAAKLAETITGVAINKGDEIVYAASSTSGIQFLTATPKITYTEITSFMSRPATGKYDMAMDAAAIVVEDSVGIKFNAYATVDTYKDATAANVYVWDSSVTGEKTLANATAVIPMEVDLTFAYNAIFDQIAPKNFADEITAQIVVLNGEEVLCQSPAETFSVAEVAQNTFDASIEDAEKNLMVAVMNYGAYAQKYFKHNVDNLANKGLPTDLATIDPDDYFYDAHFSGEYSRGAAWLAYSEIDAFSLYLDATISIRLHLDLNEYEKGAADDMYILYGSTEEEFTANNAPQLPVDRENAAAVIEGISLKDLSDVHYVALVSVEKITNEQGITRPYRYFGYNFTYSVESFAARMLDSTEANLPELLCALMELGKLA